MLLGGAAATRASMPADEAEPPVQFVVERTEGRARKRCEERRGFPSGLRERGPAGAGGRRAARRPDRAQFLRGAGLVESACEAEALREALVG